MQHFFIHYIQGNVGAGTFQQGILFPEVGSDYIGISVYFPERHRQFHADLTGGADHEDFLFYHSKRLYSKDEGSSYKFQLKKQIRQLRFTFAA